MATLTFSPLIERYISCPPLTVYGDTVKDILNAYFESHRLVETADGYRVSFSLPEIDPTLTDKVVLIADRKDAKTLDAREGPYRLVVPHDKKHARWVRQVIGISVQSPPKSTPRTKGK